MALHGREAERARLLALLDAAAVGTASAVVVRGEAGAGKSALVDGLCATARRRDLQVLLTRGVQSEAPLAFAGLHRLLRPVLPCVDRLPPPQARALRVALGEQDGASADPFVVALATLTLLTEAAGTGPVLCVVDDAQWLDQASAGALLFAARRLTTDPVALVFTAREDGSGDFVADGVPSLPLPALDETAARALLRDRLATEPPDEVVGALLAQTAGNALALVELPAALTAAQLSGTAPVPDRLALPDRVQRLFLERCRSLPEDVQTLLLVAAADDTGRLSVVRDAATRLGVPDDAVPRAERARLLRTDGATVAVWHPLVRSAVYSAATGHERRSAHRSLAAALAGTEPDRSAWHAALAADGPDDAAADALERTAERAEQSGGFAAAAAAFSRAAELTADDQRRARRLFGAARTAWAGGQHSAARSWADAAKTAADDRVLRADADRLRARIEVNVGSAATAYEIFVTAARAVAADDPVRALEMRVAAGLTRLYSPTIAGGPDDLTVPDDVGSTGAPRTRCLRHLLEATAADSAGRWQQGVQALTAAVGASADVDDLDVLANVGNAALHLGDDAAHRRCYTRHLALARSRGAGMAVLYALPRLAYADLLSGHWTAVRDAADEALRLSADVGQRALGTPAAAWLVLLDALRGDDDRSRERLDVLGSAHLGVLADPVHDLSRWAAGVRAAHAGDAGGALHHLRSVRLAPLARMAALDRLDTAVRAGEVDLAQQWLTELAAFADATRWPWARAASCYGRALLADEGDAPALLATALRHHAAADRPYERARTQLALGALLRRAQRRVEARPHLRAALAVFEDLGAQPDATRAAQELRASGETARKRDPSTAAALTPMELQVARLVVQGRSNKDVAAQLFISPRTVAFHLRGTFAKLGVSTRGELAQLDLPARGG